MLGDNEMPAGFLNPQIARARTRGGGGRDDALTVAGNIYAASRVAHVAARGLDAFGSYEAGQRAAARGDLAGAARGDEAIKSAAEGLPLGVGTLAVAFRNNVLDRKDRAAIEQTAADTERLDSKADYVRVRADRLGRGQREITATARGLEGNVERSAVESRYRSASEQERELDEQDARADPEVRKTANYRAQLAKARGAIADQRRTADRDAGRARDDQYTQVGTLSADLAGAGDQAVRTQFEQSVEEQRRAALARNGESGQALFDKEIAPRLQQRFDRDQGNQRLAESGESARAVQSAADRAKEVRLRASNEADKVEVERFRASWEQRLAVARQAVQTEANDRKRALRQQELDALESERKVADEAFKIQVKRRTDVAVARINADAAVARTQAAGNTVAASNAATKSGQSNTPPS